MKQALTNSKIKRRRVTYPIKEVDPKLLTQQQFIKECDINKIVENAKRGIQPTFQPKGTPHYGDFTDVPTIERAYDIVLKAQEAFLALPSALRAELNNDPANLGNLTDEQVTRYKLKKLVPEPGSTPPSPAVPGAGQAHPPAPASGSTEAKASDK